MVLNTIATELEKATDVKKVDLEKELIELVDVYASLEKYTSKGNANKRGIVRSTASQVPDKLEAGNTKFFNERTLLATTSINQLLRTALELYKCGSNSIATSQDRSQPSSNKSTIQCFKFLSFILNASVRLIKSFSVVGKDSILKTLVYGEIKLLGPPLLKLVWLLKLGPNSEEDHKKKEAKGRKDAEDKKEHIYLALVCLKELVIIAFQSPEQIGLIEELVSDSILDYGPKDIPTADSEDECELGDQTERSKHMFIQKIVKPLFSELLAASFSQEVEVNFCCVFFNHLQKFS